MDTYLQGTVDLHIHADPDLHCRIMDEIEVAREAAGLGMRAVVLKPHYGMNADRMSFIRDAVPNIEAFGGISLNHTVGGFNPYAVEACIQFGGKEIWMPGLYSAFTLESLAEKGKSDVLPIRAPRQPLTIFGSDGTIIPEVLEILHLVAEADIILGTGHLAPAETLALVDEAVKSGVRKVVVTHPLWPDFRYEMDVLVALAEKGAFLELCYSWCYHEEHGTLPKVAHPIGPIAMGRLVRTIRRVGPARCVLATDFGHSELHLSPPEGLAAFMQAVEKEGIDATDVSTMVRDNPAALLNL